MGKLLRVSIPNWDKFNPRNDRTNHVWFRFQNNFFTDQKVFSLTNSQQLLLIFIYCLKSEKNGDQVELNPNLTAALLKAKSSQILSDLSELVKHDLVLVDESLPLAYQTPSNGIATNKQTDKQTNMINFDFERVYADYPRKLGKAKGIDYCKRHILTQEGYDSLVSAIKRYKQHCVKERTDPKFIKHFSSFMNSWTDWCDSNAGKTDIRPVSTSPIPFVNSSQSLIDLNKPHPATNPKVSDMIEQWRKKSLIDEPSSSIDESIETEVATQ